MPQNFFKSPRTWFSSLVKGTKVEPKIPRGIRNNNPGDIRRTGIPWRGLAAVQSDPDFCVFDTMADGVRAMAIVLLHYYHLHGLKTVAEIVTRYAPGNENDTAAYIRDVCRRMGVQPTHDLDLEHDAPELEQLIEAMCREEVGSYLKPIDVINGCMAALQAV